MGAPRGRGLTQPHTNCLRPVAWPALPHCQHHSKSTARLPAGPGGARRDGGSGPRGTGKRSARTCWLWPRRADNHRQRPLSPSCPGSHGAAGSRRYTARPGPPCHTRAGCDFTRGFSGPSACICVRAPARSPAPAAQRFVPPACCLLVVSKATGRRSATPGASFPKRGAEAGGTGSRSPHRPAAAVLLCPGPTAPWSL